jgi:hypothetical protein
LQQWVILGEHFLLSVTVFDQFLDGAEIKHTMLLKPAVSKPHVHGNLAMAYYEVL